MPRFDNQLYIPYGAYELKATYQRNLLLSLITVTLLCLAAVTLGWALQVDRPPMFEVPRWVDPPIQISIEETRFVRPAPEGPIGPRPHEIDTRGVIPNAVADEELDPVESDGLIMSRDDKWGVVEDDGREPGSGGDGGSGQAGGRYDPDEEFPGIEEFRYVEEQPELIYSVVPEYPRLAKLAGDEGKVVIKALISKTGAVLDAVVYVSSGHALLDEAALAVAGEYKYRPAIQNGSPVAVWIAYNVTFALD